MNLHQRLLDFLEIIPSMLEHVLCRGWMPHAKDGLIEVPDFASQLSVKGVLLSNMDTPTED